MFLKHNSRDGRYRRPFGAVAAGSTVTLALEVSDVDSACVDAELRIWIDGEGERYLPLASEPSDPTLFTVSLPCPNPQIIWYSFVVRACGEELWMGCRPGSYGGEGVAGRDPCPSSFQITVYEPRAEEPTWYTHGLVYQIFPDRYRRGEGWREQVEAAIEAPRKGVPHRLVEDWDTPPAYDRNPDGSIASWDFYGGTLQGIREDLDRLQDLGVTAIYLNPIFEAASNHRYDVGDYLRIDPMLGSEEDFRELCRDAEEHGIAIILDGVFNHTGDDSRYFNRYGNYPDLGAWQSEDSPWRDAYSFREDGSYDCWWGVTNLPAFKKDAPQVRGLLLGEDGVIRHWLAAGARGWRLDVADELTDELIEKIRAEALDECPDAVIVGEVWEDASNKVSYGKLRRYLLGSELDGPMNYPFRSAVLDFLLGRRDAAQVAETFESLRENYPPQALRASLNLLGSHDRPRLLSALGGLPNLDAMSPDERAAWRPDESKLGLAKGRFWLAVLMQMSMPGVPCVYYGDEAGMQGLSDPHNRGAYPWGHEDPDTQTMLRNAIQLRRTLQVLVDGDLRARPFGGDVLAFDRTMPDDGRKNTSTDEDAAGPGRAATPGSLASPGSLAAPDSLASPGSLAAPDSLATPGGAFAATVLVNRSSSESHAVRIPLLGPASCEAVGGQELVDEGDGFATVELAPLGSAVACFGPEERLQKPLGQGMGILCHLTSIPTEDGKPGHLGEPARRFVDALAAMGAHWWQVLPVNPTDSYRSPYAGPSAFAGNVDLLGKSRRELQEEFMLFEKGGAAGAGADSDSDAAADAGPLECRLAFDHDAFDAWSAGQEEWLDPYCAFMALKDRHHGAPRQAWGPAAAASRYDPALLEDPRLSERARFHAWCQYRFELAWRDLADYAHERGLQIIGDIPFCISADSADAWNAPELFSLDEDGCITEEAGCPPDHFSDEGQRWGSPTYRWDNMKKDGYRWWIARLGRACRLYDYVRLDHFIGFQGYYGIAAGKTPLDAAWHPGPGMELFERAHEQLGPLPFIAEDLGVVTPAVRAMAFQCGFPGMDVLEFCDYDVRAGLRPHKDKVLYTSTHDTSTLVGWCTASFADGDEDEGRRVAQGLLRDALSSSAEAVIVPLQDAALLGDEARMNVPSTTGRNWSWQASDGDVAAAVENMRRLMRESGRSAGAGQA